MKNVNMKKQALAVIGGLAMAMNAGAAFSSTTHALAEIDWSTFSISGYGIGANAAPSYTLQTLGSTTSSNTSDWINWSSDISNNGNSFAAMTEGNGIGNGDASAQRNAKLTIFGSGFLLISANYTLSAALNGAGCETEDCPDANRSSAFVSFDLSNTNSQNSQHTSYSKADLALTNYPWETPVTSHEKTGTLTVGVLVNNGDILNFSSMVSAAALQNYNLVDDIDVQPVPVPAAAWLFGFGLAGVMGLGRKNQGVMA